MPSTLYPTPYTLYPTPYTLCLCPMPCSLYPIPCTLYPIPSTLYPARRGLKTVDTRKLKVCAFDVIVKKVRSAAASLYVGDRTAARARAPHLRANGASPPASTKLLREVSSATVCVCAAASPALDTGPPQDCP